ncbi:MAG: glutathione S-transferase N-terminal domain-containing protein [Gammaproteobacteria bacterium]|nr:glutathione S-transferase N-terminal domain-containing protein [Gammaproteobacteria bacterium]
MILKAFREGLGRLIIFLDFLTRPKKLQREDAQQAAINEATKKLSLYQFYACPFCTKARRAIRRLNLNIETRDAQKNQQIRAELNAGGGKIKVPCLRIDENDETTWLYESNTIIEYLTTQFGNETESANAR